MRSAFVLRGITPLSVGRGLAPAEYSIFPRVILSEGRSPQSNPEGVCVAQDLRGENEYPSEIPTLRVALRVRLHFVPLRMTRTDRTLYHCFG